MRFQVYHQFKKTASGSSVCFQRCFLTWGELTSMDDGSHLCLKSFTVPNQALTVQISHQNMHYIINTMNFSKSAMTPLQLHTMQPNYLNSLALLQRQNIVNILALALTNSLNAFALKCHSLPQLTASQSHSNPPPQVTPQNVIEVLSDEEEIPAKKSIKLKHEASQGFTKSFPVPSASLVHPKVAELSPTSAEVPQESVPNSPNLTKTKPIKKTKNERKQSEFQVEVPEVDLIETACPSQAGMLWSETAKLRETLIRRRVFEWVYPLKKQKKEVRLLNQ